MSIFSSSTSGNFIPKVFVFAPFPLQFSLNCFKSWNLRTFPYRLQFSRTLKALNFYLKFQGLSRIFKVHTNPILLMEFESGNVCMYVSWLSTPRRGTRDFKWQAWSNGAKSQDPIKSLGLPAKPQKIPEPNPGWSLVHSRALRDNADDCITRAM